MNDTFVHMLVYGLEYLGLYYGTYRGQVVSNSDPLNLGRLQVHCPHIHGDQYPGAWAHPISPMAGKSFGIWHVPDVGEWVHVRFDHGRIEFPMWEGGWWGTGDTTADMTVKNVVLCTLEGLKIILNRTAKSITIQQDSGNAIVITEDSIAINHIAKVVITAPEVDITAPIVKITGQLEVTGEGTFGGTHTVTAHTHPGVTTGLSSTEPPVG